MEFERYRWPVAVLSFKRPSLLKLVLESLRSQSAAVDPKNVILFQDFGAPELEECCAVFRSIFPEGKIEVSDRNLGIALNFNRAERFLFETLKAEVGTFFEDDLVLGPFYLATLDQLIDFALVEPKVSRVGAYGRHAATLEEQTKRQNEVVQMGHQWGFAMTRKAWELQKPLMEPYLDIIKRGETYRKRDDKAIFEYFNTLGYSLTGSSQDGAKLIAACVLGKVELMSFACMGKYEGREGEHFREEFYEQEGFGKTEIFPTMPTLTMPDGSFMDRIIDECRQTTRAIRDKQMNQVLNDPYLYLGSLGPEERQYSIPNFIGLALNPRHDREIRHNLHEPLPFPDDSVRKVQAQDVFEHLEPNRVPMIMDEVYRVLKPGGVFRLSVPDYNSPVLTKRSVFDARGEIIADLAMGMQVTYDKDTAATRVILHGNGVDHLWFPTYEAVQAMISQSEIRNCSRIQFLQHFIDRERFVCDEVPENEMVVIRSPPYDMRAGGKPVSIIVDFTK